MMPLDLTKPVQQRNGRAARIVCTDAKFRFPRLVALITNDMGEEILVSTFMDGRMRPDRESPNDLVNAPATRRETRWLLTFANGSLWCYGANEQWRALQDMRAAKSACHLAEISLEFPNA